MSSARELAHLLGMAVLWVCAYGATTSASAAFTTTATLNGYADPFTGNTSIGVLIVACPTVGGAPLPTGTVKFFEGATLLTTVSVAGISGPPPTPNPCGGFNPWAAATADYFQPALPPGTHTYTAVYSGDAFYAPSTSGPVTVVVPPRPTVIPTTATSTATPIPSRETRRSAC
jgi:hypothetical protein